MAEALCIGNKGYRLPCIQLAVGVHGFGTAVVEMNHGIVGLANQMVREIDRPTSTCAAFCRSTSASPARHCGSAVCRGDLTTINYSAFYATSPMKSDRCFCCAVMIGGITGLLIAAASAPHPPLAPYNGMANMPAGLHVYRGHVILRDDTVAFPLRAFAHNHASRRGELSKSLLLK